MTDTDKPQDQRDIDAREALQKPREWGSIIAGALFDFMGYLTSRDEQLILSARDLATPAVEALGKWAEKRGLNLSEADVAGWEDALARPAPEALGAAGVELSDAEIEEFVAPLIQEHLSGYARHYVTYNDGRSNDRVSSDMRNLTRAILAAAKGQS